LGALAGNATSRKRTFANFDHSGEAIDEGRYPKINAYDRSILARPSLAPYIERKAAFLARIEATHN
jgi:hypothetical protein